MAAFSSGNVTVVINIANNDSIGADGTTAGSSLPAPAVPEWFHSTSNAYLRLSSCVQPIDKVGKRVAIEGSVHHIAGEHGSDLAEILDLTVKVLSRKGAPLGTYKVLPRLDGDLGVELGAYFCAQDGFSIEDGESGVVRLSARGKQADEMLQDLAKIVSRFRDVAWQGEPIAELATKQNVEEVGVPSDDSAWERLRNAEAVAAEVEPELSATRREAETRSVHMIPILPSFPELAKDPGFALDRQWRSALERHGLLTTVTATLMPGETDCIAFDIVMSDGEGLPIGRDSHTRGVSRKVLGVSPEQVHHNLERVTAEAMDEFRRDGLDALIHKISRFPFKSPRHEREAALGASKVGGRALPGTGLRVSNPVDTNILHGQRHEGELVFARTLSSGAELRVSVGIKAALLSISPNSSDLSSWIGWTVTDREGITKESSLVRAELLEYAEMLSSGTPEQRLTALDGLRSISARKNGRPHGGSGSADKLLGFGFDADLKSFGGVVVSASAPAFDSDDQILELLNGIQLLQITKFRSSDSVAELVNFDRALFGIYPDHSLSVRTWNRLGGQLKAKLCLETCEANGGYQEIIRTVAEVLSDSEAKKETGPNRARQEIQKLLFDLVNQSGDVNTLLSPFDEKRGMRIPPLNRPKAVQAYDRSGKLARLWTKATGGDPSDMRLGWLSNSDLCLASFERFGPRQLDRIDLLTSAEGIKRVVGIFSLAQDPAQLHSLVAEFAQPLRSGEDLRELFKLTQKLTESSPRSATQVEASALAKFLEERKA